MVKNFNLYRPLCARVDTIEIVSSNNVCHRDIAIHFMVNNVSVIGFLMSNGIIKRESQVIDCQLSVERNINDYVLITRYNKNVSVQYIDPSRLVYLGNDTSHLASMDFLLDQQLVESMNMLSCMQDRDLSILLGLKHSIPIHVCLYN